jgi:hypothetical protein
MPVLTDWVLPLDVDLVLRGQGADPAALRARSPGVVQAAERALRDAAPLLAPRVTYQRILVRSLRHERLLLAEGRVLEGPLIAQHLRGASEVVGAVCTVGEWIDEAVSAAFEGDPVFALALDGLGSGAVEALATAAAARFESEAAAEGLEATIPLSPGMVGWPVDKGQPQLMDLLDPTEAGIRLSSSGMMIPRKSISFVLGIGREVRALGRTCDYCSLRETCRYQDHYAPQDQLAREPGASRALGESG